MEGLKVKAVAILMMAMFAHQTLTLAENIDVVEPDNFNRCFVLCDLACIRVRKTPAYCGLKCARKCIFKPNLYDASDLSLVANDYCKLGCSLDKCMTPDNLQDVKKMGSCVNHCSTSLCSLKN